MRLQPANEERVLEVNKWDDFVVIRTSDRATFKDCRRKWDFNSKLRMNYEPIVASDPLIFGTAFHAGMEVIYHPDTWGLPTTIELAVAAFHKSLKKADNSNDPEREAELREMHELGEGMLRNYVKEAASRDTELVPVAVEFLFLVPITDQQGLPYMMEGDSLFSASVQCEDCKPVVYMGRIDVVMVDKNYGQEAIDATIEWFKQAKKNIEARLPPPSTEGLPPVWIEDHKTTGQLGDMFYLQIDTQVSSYAWALSAMRLNVEGIIYNQCLKSYPKPPKINKNGSLSVDKRQKTNVALVLEALGMSEAEYEDRGSTGSPKYDEFIEYLTINPKEYIFRLKLGRNADELEEQRQFIEQETIAMLDNPSVYPTPGKFVCGFCAFKAPCLARSEGGSFQDMLDFGDYQISSQPVDY